MTTQSKQTNEEGWVSLHREIRDTQIMKDPRLLQVFIFCLLGARFKDRVIEVNGVPVPLKAGEALVGGINIPKVLGMRRQTWYKKLKELEAIGTITLHPVRYGFTIVAFNNWEKYQGIRKRVVSVGNQGKRGLSPQGTEMSLQGTEMSPQGYIYNNVEQCSNNGGEAPTLTSISEEETEKRKNTSPQYDLLTYFSELYRSAYKEAYIPSKGKDLSLISELLQSYSPERIREKMAMAFTQLKPRTGRIDVGYFKVCFNSISGQPNPQSQGQPQGQGIKEGRHYKIIKRGYEQIFIVKETGVEYPLSEAESHNQNDTHIMMGLSMLESIGLKEGENRPDLLIKCLYGRAKGEYKGSSSMVGIADKWIRELSSPTIVIPVQSVKVSGAELKAVSTLTPCPSGDQVRQAGRLW